MVHARLVVTFLFLSFVSFPAICANTEAPDPAPFTHGTINVVLANQTGAVVETDSQLSANGFPKGLGQKLFKIDDTTVCAIAGFYTAPTPTFAGSYSPTPSSVPAMIQQYLDERRGQLGHTMTEKMDSVVQIFNFDLDFVINTYFAAAKQTPVEEDTKLFLSEITLVGYENHRLTIIQALLSPTLDGSFLSFHAGRYETKNVGKTLEHATGGLDKEVKEILTTAHPEPTSDPILTRFYSSMKRNGGKSLSLAEMEMLTNEMVEKASSLYPGEVGGDHQKAILRGGRITVFDEPVTPTPPANLFLAGIEDHPSFVNDRVGIAIRVSPGKDLITPMFVVDGRFQGSDKLPIFQKLDGIIFTGTTFDKCFLYYTGSPLTIFDSSNVVHDCRIEVLPHVDPNLPFLRKLKRDFPQLFVNSVPPPPSRDRTTE